MESELGGIGGWLINLAYFVTAVLFILGLKGMSSPKTAAQGIKWAGSGMLVAVVVTLIHPQIMAHADTDRYLLMIGAIIIGGGIAWFGGKRVAMTNMPQMIALYNGMGGGAAGAIAAVAFLGNADIGRMALLLGVLGAIIGSVSFSGSLVAYAKLDGRLNRSFTRVQLAQMRKVNMIALGIALLIGLLTAIIGNTPPTIIVIAFFLLALTAGILVALPIGGADMPVIISLFNALTGLAVALEGFMLNNPAMIIAGTVVGAAGSLLTQLMARAMNRSLGNVLFSGLGVSDGDGDGSAETAIEGSMKSMEPNDAGVTLAYADKVIFVPGYGMAVAQAQHKIWELAKLLIDRGVKVRFAIHPVAGRMPGHMNVLLAEAGVPYDLIFDLDEINPEFPTADVALVIGANDVVNPVARTDRNSPIYGMPILAADQAKQVMVIKRGKGTGFSGVQNALFFLDNTRMVYGDAQSVVAKLIAGVKESS